MGTVWCVLKELCSLNLVVEQDELNLRSHSRSTDLMFRIYFHCRANKNLFARQLGK